MGGMSSDRWDQVHPVGPPVVRYPGRLRCHARGSLGNVPWAHRKDSTMYRSAPSTASRPRRQDLDDPSPALRHAVGGRRPCRSRAARRRRRSIRHVVEPDHRAPTRRPSSRVGSWRRTTPVTGASSARASEGAERAVTVEDRYQALPAPWPDLDLADDRRRARCRTWFGRGSGTSSRWTSTPTRHRRSPRGGLTLVPRLAGRILKPRQRARAGR